MKKKTVRSKAVQRKSGTVLAKTCPRHTPKYQQTKEQMFFLHNTKLEVTMLQLSEGEVSGMQIVFQL